MKNLFKVLIASLVLISLSTGAFAQQLVNMTATVLTNIGFPSVKALDFGSVTIGTPVTIATNNGGAGMVTIAKSALADVTVTITQGDLTIATGTGALILPYTLTQELTASAGAVTGTSTPVTSAASFSVTGYNAATSFDLYIGGTVTPVANQQQGNYTGDVTIDVIY